MQSNSAWNITIPFLQVQDANTPNSRSTNAHGRLVDYFESMYTTFASLRRFHPTADLVLMSNQELPEPYRSLHEHLNVKTRIVAFDHNPGTDTENPFITSLYYLDAINNLENKWTLLLDPDVLCVKAIDIGLITSQGNVGALPLEYSVTKKINGLSIEDAQVLHAELGIKQPTCKYYGGEIYAIPPNARDIVAARAQNAWQTMNSPRSDGLQFYTEEHIMNYVLSTLPVFSLDTYIKRIWTTHRYRTVSGNEHAIPLWHLPAEKGRGFKVLFQEAATEHKWFWSTSESEFLIHAERAMGLTKRPPGRWAKDQVGRLVSTCKKGGTKHQ